MGLAAPQHVGSFWIRDQTASPSLAGGFSTTEPPGKPPTALFALCKAAKSETISSSIIIKEPKWGGSLHTAEGVAAGLCLPLDAHYWVPSVSSGPQPPAGSTLPLWATGLLQEESALMLFSLRSPIMGPRHMGRAFLPGWVCPTLKHTSSAPSEVGLPVKPFFPCAGPRHKKSSCGQTSGWRPAQGNVDPLQWSAPHLS